jgi:ketosteroid isomerase-like protein
VSDQNRATVERYFAAVSAKDFEALDTIRHDEFVQEWHQMNERTRGRVNARQINEHHPGLPRAKVKRILGADDYWVAETTLTYGDGSVWDAVNIFEFRDGKVVRQTDYFCQPLPAPAWRAQWVEPIA